MEERLQQAQHYVTPLHAADWSKVDQKNGDLLYVGSSMRLWNRLNPANHLMWSVYAHDAKESPRIRIALWLCENDGSAPNIEAWLTTHGQPLWSNNRDGFQPWEWRDPDHVVAAKALDPHQAKRHVIGQDALGVYAWLYLPRGRTVRDVVIAGASTREGRRASAPTVWHCRTPYTQFWCNYARLVKPSDDTVCPRCGLTRARSDKLADAHSRTALECFSRGPAYGGTDNEDDK